MGSPAESAFLKRFMGKVKTAALLLLALLLQPTLVSSRHFNCANVCEEAGRGHPDRPSGTEMSIEVEHGEYKCFGTVCAVLTADYNRLLVPKPWVGVQAPVIGSRLDDVKKCAESGAFSVLDVITDLDVLEVSEVNQLHGSISVLARVKLAWDEPNLAICACGAHDLKSKYRLSSDFEDFIWTPDLAVFDSKDFKHTHGLRKLGALEVSLADHCATRVSQRFDFQVKLICPMAMEFYPLDRNVCELKLGSGSHPANQLAFRNGRQRIRHSFEDQTYRDFFFKSHEMCEKMMEVEVLGVRGAKSSFRAAGVNIVITRRWGAVLGEYIGISAALALTAVTSLFLCQSSSRATLTASLALSSVFVIITANTSTPHGEGGLNLVLVYLLGSTIFILLPYAWICLGHMSHGEGALKHFLAKDSACAIVLFISFFLFNVIYWVHWATTYTATTCHNQLKLSEEGIFECSVN